MVHGRSFYCAEVLSYEIEPVDDRGPLAVAEVEQAPSILSGPVATGPVAKSPMRREVEHHRKTLIDATTKHGAGREAVRLWRLQPTPLYHPLRAWALRPAEVVRHKTQRLAYECRTWTEVPAHCTTSSFSSSSACVSPPTTSPRPHRRRPRTPRYSRLIIIYPLQIIIQCLPSCYIDVCISRHVSLSIDIYVYSIYIFLSLSLALSLSPDLSLSLYLSLSLSLSVLSLYLSLSRSIALSLSISLSLSCSAAPRCVVAYVDMCGVNLPLRHPLLISTLSMSVSTFIVQHALVYACVVAFGYLRLYIVAS